MDDILIFTTSAEDLIRKTIRVLETLAHNHLYLKPEKCEFNKQQIEFLGLTITPNELHMCTDKIEGILSWLPPKNVKQLQKFIGFCNFYRKFIPKFSETAHPLTQLTGKTPWKWSETQDNAFSTLKKSFHPQQAQVLLLPNPNEQFFLETDASDVATGAVLYQLNEKNQHQPCGFISQTLDNTQQ